ncbi:MULTISPECIES: Y-family DNA polymerase [Pseudomonadota]|jgi:protein ImuB|uniref:DNA-directed DNA polymerase n=2 Tax=Alphaproteobacteria TaxID=28211 RepID=A0A5P2QNS1_9RHOB|nr:MULTISPECIES: DNA polymerase Y family protein [Pseudomonadota]MCS9837917.1 DNA polymerase Y family protein [Pseudomonas aeruginosa]QOD64860.1 DNA polymerase Y family protein [Ochrobactrum sp. MT180101]KAB2704073.1 DNA polymerase Y family protein [Brucella lupini]MCR8490270.1 DNA polymerase Y family protein [Brucella anthropi]MCS9841363.1 DNA polymerase Y family protein [Pseudomonas aeruginosa]
MTRVVSLFLPSWSTDRLRRKAGDAAPPAEAPLVLIGRDGNRRVVLAADAAARAAGLRAGMPVTKAQVLVPGLIVQDADPAADAEALERLAVWLLRYAPIVAPDPHDGLIIDSTGADHLHGGETVMLDGLIGRLAMSGISARGAIADTWGAAHALARFSALPTVIAPEGHGPSVLERLPLEALRIPAPTVAALRTLGFRTVGDLLAQPRAPLTLRFGPELGRRLDQALGIAAELIEPVRPADLIEVRRAFAEPIGAAETIARYIGKLVTQLCERLEAGGLGARRLDLICHRVDSRAQAVRVGMATPVRDVKRLTRLLCDKIETISPGFGIEVMTLAASVAEPLECKQIVSSLVEESTPDVSDLIDTLMNRVGERALYRLAPVASDVPERSVCRIPAIAADTGAGWPGHWPRPSRLLPAPEPVETVALLPDHPPVSFTWRGIRRRLRRGDGPERVFGEWWKRDAELVAVRDYFRVEDDAGERYWLFRAGDGEDTATGSHRWFIHGVFG